MKRLNFGAQVNIYPQKQVHCLSESAGCVGEGLVESYCAVGTNLNNSSSIKMVK